MINECVAKVDLSFIVPSFQVSVDNFTFKLFYKWSVSLFIAGSVVVVSSQFFGDPISCETVSGDTAGDDDGDADALAAGR